MATPNESQVSNTAEECSICLSSLTQSGLDVFTTACQHKFHFQCLAKNIQAQNNECPLCRTRLESLVNILNSTSNTIPVVPVQPSSSTDTRGIWATLTRSFSNALTWVSRGSNRTAYSPNQNTRRSILNVSDKYE